MDATKLRTSERSSSILVCSLSGIASSYTLLFILLNDVICAVPNQVGRSPQVTG